jgi:hypothetical protein
MNLYLLFFDMFLFLMLRYLNYLINYLLIFMTFYALYTIFSNFRFITVYRRFSLIINIIIYIIIIMNSDLLFLFGCRTVIIRINQNLLIFKRRWCLSFLFLMIIWRNIVWFYCFHNNLLFDTWALSITFICTSLFSMRTSSTFLWWLMILLGLLLIHRNIFWMSLLKD